MSDGFNIVANFDLDKIIQEATDQVELTIAGVINALEIACRETVKAARLLPSPPIDMIGKPHQPNYIDQTAYLRSSIGFAIYNRGQLIQEDFSGTEKANAGEKAPQGQATGRNLANEIAGKFNDCIVAVVVCGAEYAAAVESKGYDVLTGSAKELGNLFKDFLPNNL